MLGFGASFLAFSRLARRFHNAHNELGKPTMRRVEARCLQGETTPSL